MEPESLGAEQGASLPGPAEELGTLLGQDAALPKLSGGGQDRELESKSDLIDDKEFDIPQVDTPPTLESILNETDDEEESFVLEDPSLLNIDNIDTHSYDTSSLASSDSGDRTHSKRWHSGTREREKEAPLQSGRQMQICRPSLSMRLKSSQAPSARKCSLEPCPGALASTTTPFQKDCGASGMASALCALAPRPLVTTTYHITEHFLGTAVHLVPNILVLVELFINLDKVDAGLPTAIVNPNQALRLCLGSTAVGAQYGAISALSINNDCSRLLCGFAKGQILVIGLKPSLKVWMTFPYGRVSKNK
ncbi:Vacuolar protein sorting-associated protein 8 like protein [Chelonia mydas]|uniref:Vacuolar protein sorting-associated protein 8 like protein n=1 Tax=Chelonia mydas TaxID=8469 RepID=M7CN08_CHEMY|nr:Vacuolar protein sorting-associated protein 8 like protein [Chelonia mydas]